MAPGGSVTTITTQLVGYNMTYNAGTARRGGILNIDITIGEVGGEVAILVHVESVP